MDDLKFDALARTLSSRRSVLASALSGVAGLLGFAVPEQAEAHTIPLGVCNLEPTPIRRARCRKRVRRHHRMHQRQRRQYCLRQGPRLACLDRDCGFVSVCGRLVSCGEPDGSCSGVAPGSGRGYTCLPGNGGCAVACIARGRPCELEGCVCGVEAETGNLFCVLSEVNCEVGTPCTTNSDCEVSQMCGLNECSPGGATTMRCRSLCG